MLLPYSDSTGFTDPWQSGHENAITPVLHHEPGMAQQEKYGTPHSASKGLNTEAIQEDGSQR